MEKTSWKVERCPLKDHQNGDWTHSGHQCFLKASVGGDDGDIMINIAKHTNVSGEIVDRLKGKNFANRASHKLKETTKYKQASSDIRGLQCGVLYLSFAHNFSASLLPFSYSSYAIVQSRGQS